MSGTPAYASSTPWDTHVGIEGVRSASKPDLYILQFPEPPIAGAASGVLDFDPIPRTAEGRLALSSSEALTYEAFLEQRQTETLAQASSLLGRQVEVVFAYRHAFNGVAANISADEVQSLKAAGLVIHAEPYMEYPLLTDAGPEWIGSPAVWSGEATGDAGSLGEGVVVGIIDSGINLGHPSFSAEAEDGFVHTNPLGSGNFIGWCNPGVGTVTDTCNDKLIGTWEFLGGLGLDGLFIPGGEDENGHGTHVAGTVAGNPLTSNFGGGANPPVSGVAPRANIVAYDACYTNEAGQGLCPNVSTLAAINQVVADGIVDVINFSIGGGTQPWADSNSLAFLAAVDAGVFVSASAGNSGPGPNTMGHLQPWVASVAAASHDRYFAGASVTVTDESAPDPLVGIGAVPSLGPAPDGEEAELGVDPSNLLGCDAFQEGFFTGQIAYVDRGVCGFADKISNASAAGAIGVVVGNSNATAPIVMGATETTTVPAVMITRAAGDQLLAFADQSGPITVRLDSEQPSAVVRDESIGDIITGFSSRGPNPFNVTKPSVTAPGSQILAAVEAGGGEGAPEFGLKNGTSMSSPHNAGAAALLRALNPTWLPSEIQSALMLTARTGILADNSGPIGMATIFDEGAGRIQVDRAAASPLVLRETALNFALANPDTGGDPRTLNLAGLSDNDCITTCSFERTFRSVASGPRSFQVSLESADDISATIAPSSFTILPGQQQPITFEIDAGAGTDDWKFGQIVLTPVDDFDGVFQDRFEAAESASAEPLSMPISIFARGAVIDVDQSGIAATADPLTPSTEDINIGNIGNATLEWEANVSPFVPGEVVVGQSGTTGGGIVSGFFTQDPADTGAYTAEVFQLSQETTIGALFFEGFVSGGIPLATNTPGIRFYLYQDIGGVPAGNPEDGMANEVWSARVPNPSSGLNLSDSNIRLDLAQAGLDLPVLGAGTYWLGAAPEFPTQSPRWNWSNATSAQEDFAGFARLITPGAAFGGSFETWTDLGAIDPALRQLSFSITEADRSCGAPWLTVTPASGPVAAGTSVPVELGFDAAGLPLGTYRTNLCLSSNDVFNPIVTVPISLEVTEPTQVGAVLAFEGFEDLTEANESIVSVNVQAFNVDPTTPVRYRVRLTDEAGDGIEGQGYESCNDGAACTDRQVLPSTDADGETFFGPAAGVPAGDVGILDPGGQTTWFALSPVEAGAQNIEVQVWDVTDPADPSVIDSGAFDFTVAEPVALVQIAHLAPFATDLEDTAVDIQIDGEPALTGFQFGESTGYLILAPGEVTIDIIPVGATEPAISAQLNLMGNTSYSLIAVGDGDNQDLGLIDLVDDNSEPAGGDFRLRLGHLAPFASGDASAEVRLVDGTLIAEVDFGDVTSLEVPAGTYDLLITAPDGDPILLNPIPLTFGAGDIISAFAAGDGVKQELGVFAWPPNEPGSFLPLLTEGLDSLSEDFETPFPPDDWTLAAGGTSGCSWERNDDFQADSFFAPVDPDHGGRLNFAGTGFTATVDSDTCGGLGLTVDAEMWTPQVNLAGLDNPRLEFNLSIDARFDPNSLFVDISTDLGNSWTNLESWEDVDVNPIGPGLPVSIDLSDYETSVAAIVRFRNLAGWSMFVQVDDVRIDSAEEGVEVDLVGFESFYEPGDSQAGTEQVSFVYTEVDQSIEKIFNVLTIEQGGTEIDSATYAALFDDLAYDDFIRGISGTSEDNVVDPETRTVDIAFELSESAPAGLYTLVITSYDVTGINAGAVSLADAQAGTYPVLSSATETIGFGEPVSTDVVIDLAGQESPSITCGSVPFAQLPGLIAILEPGANIATVDFDILLETNGDSWASEARIILGTTNSAGLVGLPIATGEETPSGGAQFTGSFDLAGDDLDFELDEDGALWLGFCETFNDDGNPDAFYLEPSFLTVNASSAPDAARSSLQAEGPLTRNSIRSSK